MTENTEKDLLRCGANLWRSPQLSPQGFRNVEKPILGPRFDSCRFHHFWDSEAKLWTFYIATNPADFNDRRIFLCFFINF